ncbi:MAG: class I SAM-dependent methyltransferase [Desulforudis sp.]|jgi:2-polyprenyl-3-methyl-5-hydroxy-6-metoxy-1,4-benzoquinol methylase|nr:MAG: class I SAM-dependent methyltransferase [Desulforudis sp.]
MGNRDYRKFEDLTFDDFRKHAMDESLDCYEKIGFPEEYRKGYERYIFADIKGKLEGLRTKRKTVLDLGCGCSDLAEMVIENCRKNGSRLLLVDSREMLSRLPDDEFIEKFACRFPECQRLFDRYRGKVDAIIVYSVIQHVFLEANIFNFLDKACELLSDGGEVLIGDIPNISKRKRFFASKAGVEYHKAFTGKDEPPGINIFDLDSKKLDDGVVTGILLRYRNAGLDTYLLPQGKRLPMSNRREDILLRKP